MKPAVPNVSNPHRELTRERRTELEQYILQDPGTPGAAYIFGYIDGAQGNVNHHLHYVSARRKAYQLGYEDGYGDYHKE